MSDDISYRDFRFLLQEHDPSFEPFSKVYSDIRSRQLEGNFPGDCMSGTWPISFARIMCGWGMVKESEWPYYDENFDPAVDWPPVEPPGLDAKAKKARFQYYQRIRSAQDCRMILAHEFPVSASFDITEKWFTAEHGLIMLPEPDDEFVGGHCVGISGFELTRRCFAFENSWGPDWGTSGCGYLSFEYFERYLIESWQLHGIGLPPDVFCGSGVVPIEWSTLDRLGHGRHGGEMVHGVEVYDCDNDERMGWAFLVHRNGFLDIEDLFVRPQYRRQGICGQLLEKILGLSRRLERPLRLWVPFADWEEDNRGLVDKVAQRLGLVLFDAPFNWAAAVGAASDEGRRAELTPVSVHKPNRAKPSRIMLPQYTI